MTSSDTVDRLLAAKMIRRLANKATFTRGYCVAAGMDDTVTSYIDNARQQLLMAAQEVERAHADT